MHSTQSACGNRSSIQFQLAANPFIFSGVCHRTLQLGVMAVSLLARARENRAYFSVDRCV